MIQRLVVLMLLFGVCLVPVPADAPKSLGASLGLVVFPAKNQSQDQQNKDESSCYDWSRTNTGVDPLQVQQQEIDAQQQASQASQQAQQQAADQAAAAGAGAAHAAAPHGQVVGGAAAGALIGAIAGDAGAGALYGAAAGLIARRRRARMGMAQASAQTQQAAAQSEQAQQQAQQKLQQEKATTAQQMSTFKKGFTACLQAKGYTVQ